MARVPVSLKLKNGQKKHLLREVCKPILPRAVVTKKKVGLEIPYSQWMIGPLRPLMEEYLNVTAIRGTGIFRGELVETMVKQHLSRKADHGRFLWGMLNFMMWKRLYLP